MDKSFAAREQVEYENQREEHLNNRNLECFKCVHFFGMTRFETLEFDYK